MISQTLPDVKGYFVANQNPILQCIVDQIDHDEERYGGNLTGLALRDGIINALTQKTIDWQQKFNKIITKEEWIKLMKKDPFYYKFQSRSNQDFEDHEAILLDLASEYLKRTITLIPFLEGGSEVSFPRKSPWESFKSFFSQGSEASKASSYFLLCCTKAHAHNFYISIFRK